MISVTLRLAEHTGVQSLEMPKNVPKTSQGESSSPWADSLEDSAQGWIPKSGRLPQEGGAGCVHQQG